MRVYRSVRVKANNVSLRHAVICGEIARNDDFIV